MNTSALSMPLRETLWVAGLVFKFGMCFEYNSSFLDLWNFLFQLRSVRGSTRQRHWRSRRGKMAAGTVPSGGLLSSLLLALERRQKHRKGEATHSSRQWSRYHLQFTRNNYNKMTKSTKKLYPKTKCVACKSKPFSAFRFNAPKRETLFRATGMSGGTVYPCRYASPGWAESLWSPCIRYLT